MDLDNKDRDSPGSLEAAQPVSVSSKYLQSSFNDIIMLGELPRVRHHHPVQVHAGHGLRDAPLLLEEGPGPARCCHCQVQVFYEVIRLHCDVIIHSGVITAP